MSKKIKLKADALLDGRKIEHILEKHLKISSSQIGKLKRNENGIMLNGVQAKVIEKVNEGDVLEINIEEKESKSIAPSDIPLKILFEDDEIIAVNKPRSMPVHPSRCHVDDTLANAVMHHLGNGKGFHIITRLDRDTSGVVLIAKNPVAAAKLTEDIKNRRMKKEYVAVVNGAFDMEKGVITMPIKKTEGKGISRCVSEEGKEAVTEYRKIKTEGNFSVVELYPVTGRTHQLRVHMSYMGCPIYGDSMYGAPQKNEQTRLHCKRLTFIHCETGESISIEAEMPDDMKNF